MSQVLEKLDNSCMVFLQLFPRDLLSHTHTHTHTHIYIFIDLNVLYGTEN